MGERFLTVYSPEEVIEKIFDLFDIDINVISIPTEHSFGYYIAEDIRSKIDLPPFRKSLVDGYAVKSTDIKGASYENPVFLKNLGEVKIGTKPAVSIKDGSTCYVPTGGVVPDGADAVVMVEDTEIKGDTVFIFKDVQATQNIFEKGAELVKESVVLTKGVRINELNIGLLNFTGVEFVQVISPLKVGLISTGDEVTDEHPLPYGKIFDYNGITLKHLLLKDGFIPSFYGVVKDNAESIKEALKIALKENDFVIMTGGTSKGNFDFTVNTINSLGKPGVIVHGLNASPGKPTIFGIVNRKLVVGLSGNPLASVMIYSIVIRNLISKKLKIIIPEKKIIGKLSNQVSSRKGRTEFVLGRLKIENNENIIEPLLSDSSFTFVLNESHGFIKIPQEKEGLLANESVEFFLW
ncbi:molybdopterin molybdotransferase MoeA [Caldisericum exile]|uniref:Molybdopterin molybdenumtransferase n=1 Tax=Caldisericum exile (strain DSM 21853 / NBRC 104410 / AZM16c01) TaxID=511051 RepID=A0A7U6JGW7_CALEA|nr:molybdopterin molybdotransferase MoeA [Caldisericum exile]BAL80977.1 molybdopterin biosynthesis protein MoeA [Caldisericum exile AZM16c01]